MKTVAAPIYFGLLQTTETAITTDKRRRKENLYKDFLAGGQMWVDWASCRLWPPQFWSFTKYKNHNTNVNNKKKRKANLEEDL